MPLLLPTQETLRDVFATRAPFPQPASISEAQKQHETPRSSLFPAFSAVDDMKSKAGALSKEAQEEINKASHAAQAKAGKIELYSAKYYAACTLGGLIACVGTVLTNCFAGFLTELAGCYTYRRNAFGSRQMPSSSRFENVQRQL